MGIHLRVFDEIYLMNTNMTSLEGFLKSLHSCALAESNLSIERVKYITLVTNLNTVFLITWVTLILSFLELRRIYVLFFPF